MKILVIGGSYFFGRWFVQLTHDKHAVTVLNRGNIPIDLPNVNSIILDRHDFEALKGLKGEHYDCIVDFCAYEKQDIESICECFLDKNGRYIFISTVDVYKKGSGKVIDEDMPIEEKASSGQLGAYINGKAELEKELCECAERIGFSYSIVRPAIIYGPCNYAPREKLFFDWIEKAGQVILPSDSDGCFQFIFVRDAALALLRLCELETEELPEKINFADDEIFNYNKFADALKKAVDKDFERILLPVEEIMERNIPLPFPFTKEESEIYSTKRFKELGIETTDLCEGLKITARMS